MAGAVKVTFGGKPVYSVRQTLDQMHVREHAKVDRFNRRARVELCNSFINPLGQQPCKGWLLMKKKDIVALRTSASHTLKIEQPDGLPTVECKRLLITHAEAVFNADDSDEMLYVAEIADRRWYGCNSYYDLDFVTPQKDMFNLPAELYPGQYYDASRNAGNDYTWEEMFNKVWPAWLSSSPPSFPTDLVDEFWTTYVAPPNTTPAPVGFDFRGHTPYESLGIILGKLGFALNYRPDTGFYKIAAVYNTTRSEGIEGLNIGLEDKYAKYLEDEMVYYDPTIAMLPKGVSVNFHVRATQPGSENTYSNWLTGMIHRETVAYDDTDPVLVYSLDNTYAQVWDDLPAELDPFTNTISNTTQLQRRATERMRAFYRQLTRARLASDRRYRKAFAIALPFYTTDHNRGVAWRSREDDRWWTEIYNHPRFQLTVNESTGQFDHLPSSTRVRPPLLGPQLPNYPYEVFVGRVEGEPDADGWQTVVERRLNPGDNTVTDGITFKAKDANA